MASASKGKITTNLVQLALVLLFLKEDSSYQHNNQPSLRHHNTELSFESSTSYAHSYVFDHGGSGHHIHPKALSNFTPSIFDFDNEDLSYRYGFSSDFIRNAVSAYITPAVSKSMSMHTFQNVTAYVLSDATAAGSTIPNIPPRFERNDFLLSVNADVPEQRTTTEESISSNVTASVISLRATTDEEDSEGSGFRLVSGNIVFLSDSAEDRNELSPDHEPILESPKKLPEELGSETFLIESEEPFAGEDRTSFVEAPLSPVNVEVTSERLWDQLRSDAQLFDEDFSLALVLDDENNLDVALESVFSSFGNEYDESGILIPPAALHDESLGIVGGGANSGSTGMLARSSDDSMDYNEVEDAAVALDSFLVDLETESEILILDSAHDLLSEQTEFLEDNANAAASSELGTLDDCGLRNCVIDSELENEVVNGAGNNLDMIQTASIYSNGRPNCHPSQARGFQVHPSRMQGFLRGNNMEQQRLQEQLATLFSFQPGSEGSSGASLGGQLQPGLPPHFQAHPHHHHHGLHHPSSYHPSMHTSIPSHHHVHHVPYSAHSAAAPPPGPYPDSSRSVLLQNATLPVPLPENASSSYPSVPMGPPPNLGSALASSMHLTNHSESLLDQHYKLEASHHEMAYYPNMGTSEGGNHTSDGFLSSILNDDDLQLMDMAMNEGMHHGMRGIETPTGAAASSSGSLHAHGVNVQQSVAGAGASEDRMEASSDSAVSSMGSDSVPPLNDTHGASDNEWTESDGHVPHEGAYGGDYTNKLRGYEYYGKDGLHRSGQVAQKKHQLYGKRLQHEPMHPYPSVAHSSTGLAGAYVPNSLNHHGNSSMDHLDIKYECPPEYSRHGARSGECMTEMHNNHSYALPHSQIPAPHSVRPQRMPSKDKPKKEYLSRDEKRARALSLPMTTEDIINLPMDEFNERLSKYDLTESQLSLIRDIRRRGKNKVAAQNCRKRKLDQILQLAEEVQKIRDRKLALLRDQDELATRRNTLKEKYSQLYRHVFHSLRDRDGNPYNPHEYSLQHTADGSMMLVPSNSLHASSSNDHHASLRRGKTKDEMKKDGA